MKAKALPTKIKASVSTNGSDGTYRAKKKVKKNDGQSPSETKWYKPPVDALDFKELLGVLTEVKVETLKHACPWTKWD